MRRSEERILTTHGGRLERPEALTAMMNAEQLGRPTTPEFAALLRKSVDEVVRAQSEAGIDVVCDGEFGKTSWNGYLGSRLAGFEPADAAISHASWQGFDRREFADFYSWSASRSGSLYYSAPGIQPGMVCTGPVSYVGHAALQEDIGALLAATQATDVAEAFMPSTSPGSVRWANQFYASDDEYLFALADALREEYQAIVDSGLVLQIDDPLLPTVWDQMLPDVDEGAYQQACETRVEAVNRALRGIPRERVRLHVCWGSWHGPHASDVPLKTLMPLLRRLDVGAFVVEAGNVRHQHEWETWRELDDDRLVIPGVVSHATDTIEHPELVAFRIRQFADVVGRERVIAGTDCGLGYRVHPQIGWAKLRALAEGARLASTALW